MRRLFIMFIASSLIHAQAFALVVSDPGAYTRMAQQIQEAQKIYTEAKRQVAEMQRIYKNLSGNLGRGKGSIRDIRRIKSILEDVLPAFYDLTLPDGTKLDKRSTEDIVKGIDNIFISSGKHPTEAGLTEEQKRVYRQRALKASLAYSESLLSDTTDSLEKLETLAAQIDETETLKDAQDLTNRYLQELLTGQTKVILLLAQMSRAEAALSYKGVGNEEQGTLKNVGGEEYLDMLGKKGSKYWKPRREAQDTMHKLMGY